MDTVLRIYQAANADDVTRLFIVLIGILLAAATAVMIGRSLRVSARGARLVDIMPNVLATIGVLGTFTGILIGLLDFDVDAVDESVPSLLAGLKIAFVTSIVGIAAAIVFRLLRALLPTGDPADAATPEKIHDVLNDIRNDGRTTAAQVAEQLGGLRAAIAADGDGSLLTQIQKLRATTQDGHGEMVREFREFAAHMVENNQKAIVEALEGVIRDFNNNLTEQFGENFKELNSAVGALVSWQENYRLYVDAAEQRLETATTALTSSATALASVQESAESIPTAVGQLRPVLDDLQAQTTVLGAHLDSLAALRDKALEAFPMIEANLEKLTADFASNVKAATESSRGAVEEAKAAHASVQDSQQALMRETSDAQAAFKRSLDDALEEMTSQTKLGFERHRDLIDASATQAQTATAESWSQSVDRLNEQFEKFDEQMQTELQRALELLGQNLASISEKLVADYTPLTQELRALVNAAGQNRHE